MRADGMRSCSENFRVFLVWRVDGLQQKSVKLYSGFSITHIFREISWIAKFVDAVAVEM